jgi:hypothetical protein
MALLRSWFESHRAKYDEPARYDFDKAVVTGDRLGTHGARLRPGAQQWHQQRCGSRPARLTNRPRANLEQSYGVEFAAALEAVPPGEWRVLPTRDGPRSDASEIHDAEACRI